MPRHFSEEERLLIQQNIITTAKELFIQYGLGKTTISDITEKAQIGKGTFYLLFKSKGDLFMKIYTDEWMAVHEEIDRRHLNKKGDLSSLILNYIYDNRSVLLSHPILSEVYNRHTLSLISEPAVSKAILAFRELSNSRLITIIESWIETNNISTHTAPETISGMMRSLSYLNYHKDEIGEDVFNEVIEKFVEGITLVVNK